MQVMKSTYLCQNELLEAQQKLEFLETPHNSNQCVVTEKDLEQTSLYYTN